MIDKDLDDSPQVEALIKNDGHIVQFVEFNSEYLLLRFANKNLKTPSDFNSLFEFRLYCKNEFKNHFNKKASEFKDADFDLIFINVDDVRIRGSFRELFSTLD